MASLLQRFFSLIASMRSYLIGKRIVFVGQAQAGKTTLTHFLLNGSLPDQTEVTAKSERYSSANHLERLRFPRTWKVLIDGAGGHAPKREKWEYDVRDCDILFYLIHANRLAELNEYGQYAEYVNADCDILEKFLSNSNPQCFIVITHMDLISSKKLQRLHDSQPLLRLQGLLGGAQSVPIIKGSLATIQEATKLAKAVLSSFE